MLDSNSLEALHQSIHEAHIRGRVDDEIELRVKAFTQADPAVERPVEQLDIAAHLLCDIGESLADPASEEQWTAATRHAKRRFVLLEEIAVALFKAKRLDRVFALSQRMKSPSLVRRLRAHTAARPDLSELGRRYLELTGAESKARSALRDDQRRGLAQVESEECVAKIQGIVAERKQVEAELRQKNPEELASVGGVLNPQDLLHAFPANGSACWVDVLVTPEFTILLLIHRKGEKMDILGVATPALHLRNLATATSQWFHALASQATAEAELPNLMEFLHETLMCGLGKILRSRRHWQITMIPHLSMHALPLHLAPVCDSPGHKFVFEEFSVGYAPCIQLALTTSLRGRPEAFIKGEMAAQLFADPFEDLPAALREQQAAVDRLAHHSFNAAASVQAVCTSGAAVTPQSVEEGIANAPMVVLGCHARFVATDPFGSGLMLNGPAKEPVLWTVDRIFTRPNLQHGPVVVLSACDSGMNYFQDASEVVALPPALVTIGASAVVASLWPVHDLAASFVVERFVHHVMDPGETPTTALACACQDVRDMSRNAVLARCDEILADMETRGVQFGAGQDAYVNLGSSRSRIEEGPEKPFASPFLWGGFFVMGCGWRLIEGNGVQARGAQSMLNIIDGMTLLPEAADLFGKQKYLEAQEVLHKAIPCLEGIWLARALLLLGDCMYHELGRTRGMQVFIAPTDSDRNALLEMQQWLRKAHDLLTAEKAEEAVYCGRLLRSVSNILHPEALDDEPQSPQ